jgi:hypothetical protein
VVELAAHLRLALVAVHQKLVAEDPLFSHVWQWTCKSKKVT